ncbi:hypothetical protein [Catellatospora sp. NPDC049609]|uniref:hypothetical protein n=1 Tax=Catellatospora sp. NPDC049609 TaxID=3155505 RepID=UPI0034316FED
MTKLLDRVLGMAAAKTAASAGCPPDSWTECYTRQQLGPSSWETCTRTVTQTGSCGVSYGPSTCRCTNYYC